MRPALRTELLKLERVFKAASVVDESDLLSPLRVAELMIEIGGLDERTRGGKKAMRSQESLSRHKAVAERRRWGALPLSGLSPDAAVDAATVAASRDGDDGIDY